MTDRTGVLDQIEGKSATLFLVAGGLLVVFAANTGARTFADAGVSAVHSIFGPAGFFVGIVGLFGLYPALADRSPLLARAAAVVAAVPLVGWFVVAGAGIGSTARVLPGASVLLPGPAFIVVILTTLLAYVLFAATSLRTDAHSRTVGVLLLAPAAVFLTLIVGAQVLPPAEWLEFAIDSGHALALLAVGGALRADGVPTEPARAAPDSTP